MNWREQLNDQWRRLGMRERRLIAAAGFLFGLVIVYWLVVTPFLDYREDLRDEIAADRERLENARAYLGRAGDITRERDALAQRLQQLRSQLVPGDTPTLAAANLQNTLHSLAAEKGVEIQSTQVMRDEVVGDFQRISERLTVTGELKGLADFLAGVEYGPQRVNVTFLEISRRGAVLRGKSARALSATLEVSAFLQGNQPAPPVPPGAKPAAAPAATPGGKAMSGKRQGGPMPKSPAPSAPSPTVGGAA